ncbi:MAG: hypothetical protein LBT46_00560 [Planctomycetaceae bacterium]|nr:hypothetical protein [Planctomycetaceae bacterium]
MKKILFAGLGCLLCVSSVFAAERIVTKTVITTEEKSAVQDAVTVRAVPVRPVAALLNAAALNRAERRAKRTQRWADVIETQRNAEAALREACSKQ